jgi:hypothetical protein
MVDVQAFAASVDAAHRFEVPIGSQKYQLRLPPAHTWRVTYEKNRDAYGNLLDGPTFRALLNVALVAWEGLRTVDILPEYADEPLPFSADARTMLLDHRQDIADELAIALVRKRNERTERMEEARKNLLPAPSGA